VVPCLGRTILAVKVRKRRAIQTAPSTAPSGGGLWHGFAVRRPLLGGGGAALTFGRLAKIEEVTRCTERSRWTGST
jgi:hypothetical protein